VTTGGEVTKTAEATEAEVEKFRAEAAAAWALAKYNEAEARKANIDADRSALDLESARRKQAKELAGDEHHFVYTFSEPVSKSSVDKCIAQLATWLRQATGDLSLEIVFNSPGGAVIDGLALFDFIRHVRSQGHHVTTICLGMAASMAGVLLQAGDVRAMGREAVVLIHEVSFGAGGKMSEVEDEVAFGKMLQSRLLKILAERSTLTERQIAHRWKKTDWWLASEECLELGFVDEVR